MFRDNFLRIALVMLLGLVLLGSAGCCVTDAFEDNSDGVVDDGDL